VLQDLGRDDDVEAVQPEPRDEILTSTYDVNARPRDQIDPDTLDGPVVLEDGAKAAVHVERPHLEHPLARDRGALEVAHAERERADVAHGAPNVQRGSVGPW
jgi:hypothetical protein